MNPSITRFHYESKYVFECDVKEFNTIKITINIGNNYWTCDITLNDKIDKCTYNYSVRYNEISYYYCHNGKNLMNKFISLIPPRFLFYLIDYCYKDYLENKTIYQSQCLNLEHEKFHENNKKLNKIKLRPPTTGCDYYG